MAGDWWRKGRWIALPMAPVALAAAGIASLVCVGLCMGGPCFTTGLRYGVWPSECPSGKLRLGANVSANVVRGDEGYVAISPVARFVEGGTAYDPVEQWTMYRGASAELELRDAEDRTVPGLEIVERHRDDGVIQLKVRVPKVDDGEYKLHVRVTSPFESIDIDVPLSLYAPAIAHVMTDRPLYRPGQEVLLRSVLLRRTDLTPLDGRPGRWRIVAPDGTEMMIERDKAGPFGVADSSFPLDTHAEVGTWRATWESGAASDSVSFDVKPFRLPRVMVDAAPSERWYRIGQRVVVEGTARYNSGAPIRDASVQVAVRVTEGRWTMPLEWEEPFVTRTDAHGRYRVVVGDVPPDLLERSILVANVRVTEAAGETASASARVVLSQYELAVEAVTELGDGLVGGFNNRAYLRVTTPDGRPLSNTAVAVTPWWDPKAKAHEANTDVDGVAAIQLDPGKPTSIVVPAPPWRPRPVKPELPVLISATEILSERGLDLAERRALDAVLPAVTACGDLAPGGATVTVGVRVDAAGRVTRVVDSGGVGKCVGAAMRGLRLPPDDVRTFSLQWRVPDTLRPSLQVEVEAVNGATSAARPVLEWAAIEARRCLPRGSGISGSTALELHWSVRDGDDQVETAIASTGGGLGPERQACIVRAFQGLTLDEPADTDAIGTARFTLVVPASGESRPQDTFVTGYHLRVATESEGTTAAAPLVLREGFVPALRIRATPTLARGGDEVMFELIRGPGFAGEIPDKIDVYEGGLKVGEAEVNPDTRAAKFKIPDDVDGFLQVDHAGARAVVWVEPRARLSVSIATEQQSYAPGETARLLVSTRAGDAPKPAGVGLVGVDATLGQLAPLLGPEEYGRVTVRATADRPAFGAFDPRALVLGQVHGENAAKAAVLRITNLPQDPAGDEYTYASAASSHDDEEVLARSFYRALAEVTRRVRDWEKSSPEGQVMTGEQMIEMWEGTLRDLAREGDPAVDAFGRELRLNLLPTDLLAQVDPRQVVADSTRLPEDVQDWTAVVAKEVR